MLDLQWCHRSTGAESRGAALPACYHRLGTRGAVEGAEPGSDLRDPGRVEVIDEHGEACPPGEVGDIAVHGRPPSLFREYWKDEAATEALGASLAPHLAAGDVVTLSGPLGAGKTRFVAGLARGVQVSAPVRSPTVTLVNE